MKKCKIGELKANGVKLEPHELETIMYFLRRGEDIELIPPSNTPNNKNPDLLMRGIIWEMKGPSGKSPTTVEHLFRKATRQSQNLIFDLRCFKGDHKKTTKLLCKIFQMSRRARKLKIITKNGELIEKP